MHRTWLNLRFGVQAVTAAISNGYFKGFANGTIYQGVLKHACVPTLNCYSCPGALFACPVGAAQVAIAGGGGLDVTATHSLKDRLNVIFTSTPFFIIGFLFLIGVIFGRATCGWACPFGWLQDIANKIPSPKFKGANWLKYLKYGFLIVFVILLPAFWVDEYGGGEPSFCKFICPAGTLEGGIPLAYLNPDLRSMLGKLFAWKVTLLAILMAMMVFIKRPFCRWVCPLGAFLAPLNKVSFYKLEIEKDACISCGMCSKVCPTDLYVPDELDNCECIRCLECKNVCPKHIIKITGPLMSTKTQAKEDSAQPETL